MRLLAITQNNDDGYTISSPVSWLKLKKIYLLPNQCLGTLMRLPDKEEKVPRLAPACLILRLCRLINQKSLLRCDKRTSRMQ